MSVASRDTGVVGGGGGGGCGFGIRFCNLFNLFMCSLKGSKV